MFARRLIRVQQQVRASQQVRSFSRSPYLLMRHQESNSKNLVSEKRFEDIQKMREADYVRIYSVDNERYVYMEPRLFNDEDVVIDFSG
jgi:hypothetical protein